MYKFAGKCFTVDGFVKKYSEKVMSLYCDNPSLTSLIKMSQCVGLVRGMVSPYFAEKICLQLGENIYEEYETQTQSMGSPDTKN